MKITTIGLDIAKMIFHYVAVNQRGKFVQKKKLKRRDLASHMSAIAPCLIVMEACGGANYWARVFLALGHEVKLIAPQFVKPFVRGNKNDYNDAQAIAEAAQRPTMRFVPIKTLAQQDIQNVHRQRERIKKERTALVNQIRGLLAEYGIVINKSITAVRRALPIILDDTGNELSVLARAFFAESLEELRAIEQRFDICGQRIKASNKENEVCKRLNDIHGIGPIIASATYAAAGDGKEFKNSRHFPAWLGLVPGQHSSGDKPVLLGISKRGNTYLRTLYIHGARSVLRHSINKTDRFSRWALSLQARIGFNKACVAIANKLARIAWVIMARGETYKPAS